MKIALISTGELIEFCIQAWREFREQDIDCQVYDNPDKAEGLIIEPRKYFPMCNKIVGPFKKVTKDTSTNGINTIYKHDELLATCLHKNVIKALTEPNPLWTEFRKDINQFIKPRDKGIEKGDSAGVTLFIYSAHNVKDTKRFEKNMLRCAKGLVHGITEYMLLSK